ncbi:ABC transporter ATP-binding protein [Parafrigoribacterium humi]|jgi:branched-chain amino acid transport system ATP-binding protein|uniref:ABC transporter ATP-binding protein n=1 Tax=Parafrigoribacterium humi TaxID=3144664 RepID=UPI0032EC34E7
MLKVDDVVVRYGAATALDGVSLTVEQGEMVALVGPNGAGKSTLVNAISSIVPVASGSITIGGTVAQVPEGRQLFADMTVDENLRLGAWKAKSRDTSTIYELLPDLVALRRHQAGTLSGGQQQMVAVGRALMAAPDLLVIDELSLGLAPLVVADLATHLKKLNQDRGTTILLIEQEVSLAFRLCSRAYLLEAGKIVTSGKSSDLAKDPVIQTAYLGEFSANTVTRAGEGEAAR